MSVLNDSGVTKFSINKDTGNVSGSGTADFGSNLQVAGTGHIEGACTFDSTVLAGSTLSSSIAIRTGGGDAWGFSNAGVAKFAATSINGALTGVTTLAASGLLSVASISMDDGSTLGPDSVAGLWTFSADGDTIQADGAYDFDLASHDGTNGLKLGGALVTATADELNYTDVSTIGTAQASKALVADANIDITGLRNLTINGTFSDGNYTFDDSGNVSGLGTVGCGAITSTGASSLGSISSVAAIASSAHISGATMQAGTLTSTGNVVGTTLTGSTAVRTGGGDAWGFSNAGAAKFAAITATSLSASSTLLAVGATTLESTLNVSGAVEMANAVINVPNVGAASFGAADFFVGRDSATGDLQVRTRANVVIDMAGVGLNASTGSLSLDLNELPAYANVTPANDSFAILSNASGSVKSTFTEVALRMAGSGVTATNGVFSVDTTGGDSMSRAPIASGDTVAVGLNYFAALVADATVTLPATPTAGDICVIKAHTIAAGKEIIINRGHGSQTIDGLATISMRSNYGAVTLIAATAGNTADWRIV